jgi:putative membrane protein
MEGACSILSVETTIVLNTLRRAAPTIRNNVIFISPLLLAWLAALALMPIAQWSAGQLGLTAGVFLGVLLQTSLVVMYLAQAAGPRRAALTAGMVALTALLFEALGWRTGFPFGAYHYTAELQPQLAGVPVLIPLAWLMMLPPAWAVAQRVTGRRSGVAFVVVSALAFTTWDLFVDPQMVQWGLWVWERPGVYFGVPLSNYGGWLLVSALITMLVRPPAIPGKPLLVIFTLTWLVEVVGQVVFWRLHGPALWGSAGMGLFVWLAWRGERRRGSGNAESRCDAQGQGLLVHQPALSSAARRCDQRSAGLIKLPVLRKARRARRSALGGGNTGGTEV